MRWKRRRQKISMLKRRRKLATWNFEQTDIYWSRLLKSQILPLINSMLRQATIIITEVANSKFSKAILILFNHSCFMFANFCSNSNWFEAVASSASSFKLRAMRVNVEMIVSRLWEISLISFLISAVVRSKFKNVVEILCGVHKDRHSGQVEDLVKKYKALKKIQTNKVELRILWQPLLETEIMKNVTARCATVWSIVN